GLKVTQFSILRILANEGEANMTALAERMALERTTLTRNLGPLERDGFVEVVTGEDPRSRVARITSNGRRALADAEVYWQDTQRHVIGSLGPEQATRMFDDLSEITQVARD
ncbi:MAG: winged helix-turn-helix transcriptional regulator, partial [Alphaproteobacteria bacterium]|nr:winged helix-turn-helix transcriptional regulator [Alphaproteobacteria bacterium]